uniref:Putative galactofuranosyltransferase n=1 Tax=Angomonas deanei TaxID=59799 RepID=C6K3N0_9TRYP|nr:putative galactofuranosyltransferase [Angomonas deanei]
MRRSFNVLVYRRALLFFHTSPAFLTTPFYFFSPLHFPTFLDITKGTIAFLRYPPIRSAHLQSRVERFCLEPSVVSFLRRKRLVVTMMKRRRRCKPQVAVPILLVICTMSILWVFFIISAFDSPGGEAPAPTQSRPYFDENLTRPGEPYISFDAYLDCLAQRLNVDRHTKQELPFAQWNTTMPYLVVPVTVEQGDMKALACNMSVAVRHLTYVQNGGVGSMTAFLDGVAAAFAFTRRLKVVRMPHNFGYSVALNVAMRDALSLPFEEVPFLMMGNNDVRFPAGMLEAGMPQMYAQSLAGRARVAELEAEVATEPNEHTPPRFRDVPLRSTDGRHVLVTSRLLPDRIRYMSKDERRNAFKDFAGPLYVDHNVETAFWGLTRLAMEVTGYFDENCYPAYYEDTDYLRRLWLLGFKRLNVPGFEASPMWHLGNGAILAVKAFTSASAFRDVRPFILGAGFVIRTGPSGVYTFVKYDLQDGRWPDVDNKEPYPRNGLPLDVFVINEERRSALETYLRKAIEYFTPDKPGGETNKPAWYLFSVEKQLRKRLAPENFKPEDYYRSGEKLRVRKAA